MLECINIAHEKVDKRLLDDRDVMVSVGFELEIRYSFVQIFEQRDQVF